MTIFGFHLIKSVKLVILNSLNRKPMKVVPITFLLKFKLREFSTKMKMFLRVNSNIYDSHKHLSYKLAKLKNSFYIDYINL